MQHALQFAESPVPQRLPFADYALPAREWNGIVLVGEAPGAEEARLGKPFVGRSGQLLDKILERAEINRTACLVANVFRYQPPGNKVDHFFISRRAAQTRNIPIAEKFGKFGSTFCRTDFAREIEHLAATLAAQRPKIVIALGRTPMWALTGENGLLDKVGNPLPCRLFPSVKVIPTFHPSFILRGNWSLQDQWLAHFQQALEYAI
ncbi:MAG: uracil-DNA glycosylase [Alphaproteobacteria bacterium]|nr:uracil-DNA glycosylase [Alphaproteobacteria bacterium]